MYSGVKVSHKELRELAKYLGCEQPMGIEWLKYREGKNYIRIAYSQGLYGCNGELFYLKNTGEFVLI